MSATLPCPDDARLRDLLDERLPPAELARLTAHLGACPRCRSHLEKLAAGQDSWEAARALGGEPPGLPASALLPTRVQDAGDLGATLPPEGASDLPPLGPPGRAGSLGRIDHYEVLERVGRGGMGVVLRAFDEKLHRVVALKVMAPELAAAAAARQRFVREARAAAAVAHEHVVTTHAVEAEHTPPYLVMQFVAGQSLQGKLDRAGALETREILRIGAQIAAGLAAAHKQGLVHRDVKPANILLENGVERVKITDFGLARAANDVGLPQSGVIAGTPLYMAPEQAQGQHVDHRADLFSLGSVLYAMCTGLPPFRAENTLAVLRRVVEDAPRPIREAFPEVPTALAALVARLHAKDPAARPQSAAEVAEELSQMLAQLQVAGRVASAPAIKVPEPPPPPARRLRWAIAALGLLSLLGVAAGVVFWPGQPATNTTATEPAAAGDLEKMQGAWEPVHVETEGKSQSDDALQRHRVTFADNRVVNARDGATFTASTVAVDANTTPKCMDWDISVGGGKPFRMLGVYELDGDHLKVNLAPESAGRPKSLTDRHPRGHYYWLARSRPSTARPFVVLASTTHPEQPYQTLQEAVDAATTGETIEIRGNGPFIVPPLELPRPLLLRAGAGYRPVVELRREDGQEGETLLRSRAALVIEGVTLFAAVRFPPSGQLKKNGPCLIYATAPLQLAHCTLLVRGEGDAVSSIGGKIVRLNHCKVLSTFNGVVMTDCTDGEGRVEDCVLQAGAAFSLLSGGDNYTIPVHFRRNTLLVGQVLLLSYFDRPSVLTKDEGLRTTRLHWSGNVVDASYSQINILTWVKEPGLTTADGLRLVPRLLAWTEAENVYSASKNYLCVSQMRGGPSEPVPREFKSRAEWNKYLGGQAEKAVEGRIVYQGPSPRELLAARFEDLPPETYRLHPTSAGKGAGPGGKDLGADVDEVGPGAPYERWRASAEYARWRKEADALLQGGDR